MTRPSGVVIRLADRLVGRRVAESARAVAGQEVEAHEGIAALFEVGVLDLDDQVEVAVAVVVDRGDADGQVARGERQAGGRAHRAAARWRASRRARPSSVVNARSVLPSPLKSAATIESGCVPEETPLPAAETTGVAKVPLPLPVYTATA